ncbi:hypothetical protein JCGZ_24324 [Jatropha curcas]|uniref:Uncharacterized protein n=1 Tax=Jatropha curcas TaxID=180498 RepID=A0A067LDH5_JATCU|nr:hypothetical protein JCGZ_24324 [Jatropha curcas]
MKRTACTIRRLSFHDRINQVDRLIRSRATDASGSDQRLPEGVETVVHHRKRSHHHPPRRSPTESSPSLASYEADPPPSRVGPQHRTGETGASAASQSPNPVKTERCKKGMQTKGEESNVGEIHTLSWRLA